MSDRRRLNRVAPETRVEETDRLGRLIERADSEIYDPYPAPTPRQWREWIARTILADGWVRLAGADRGAAAEAIWVFLPDSGPCLVCETGLPAKHRTADAIVDEVLTAAFGEVVPGE